MLRMQAGFKAGYVLLLILYLIFIFSFILITSLNKHYIRHFNFTESVKQLKFSINDKMFG